MPVLLIVLWVMRKRKQEVMAMDIVVLGIVAAFFAMSFAYTRACDDL